MARPDHRAVSVSPTAALRTFVLTIPGKATELSHNQWLNHHAKAARIKKWRTAARMLAATEINWPPRPRRVRLSWHIRHGRSVDPAQLHGTAVLKAVEDGLVDAHVMPDDDAAHVEWGLITQEVGPEWRAAPQLVITIEVLEEGGTA